MLTGIMGVGGLLASLGGAIYIVVTVWSVFFGPRLPVPATAAAMAPGYGVPGGVLNKGTILAFNELWYRVHPRRRRDELQSISRFFYPLDLVDGWNRMYGPRGFLQWQCQLPFGAEDVLRHIVESLADHRAPSFLAVLKYFGDADPSGRDIPRYVEKELRSHAPNADITFTVAAVTDEQIVEYGLPTRPTKTTDSRAKGWEGGSVELDAIPPAELRRLVEACITDRIDRPAWQSLKRVEAAERETLAGWIETLGREGDE